MLAGRIRSPCARHSPATAAARAAAGSSSGRPAGGLTRLPSRVTVKSGPDAGQSTPVKLDRLDPAVDRIVPAGAQLERIATGFTWTEGPVWLGDSLYFADIPANTIHKWTPGKGVSVVLKPSGYQGAAMYDPLAVGTVIDPTLVTLKSMHVDVETRGEFTRGETVANRMGYDENNVLHGDHYEIAGLVPLKPNARVCVASDGERFVRLFVARITGNK